MMYSAMSDVAMMSMLMTNRGYYYGAAPMAPMQPVGAIVYTRSGGSIVLIMLVGLVVLIVAVVVIRGVTSSRKN